MKTITSILLVFIALVATKVNGQDLLVPNFQNVQEYEPFSPNSGSLRSDKVTITNDGNYYISYEAGIINKYNPLGGLLWTSPYAFNHGSYITKSGEIYGLITSFQGTIKVDTIKISNPEKKPINILIKLDETTGKAKWHKVLFESWSGNSAAGADRIVVDNEGNIYIVDVFIDSLTIGGKTFVSAPKPNNPKNRSSIIAKYNNNGNLIWAKPFLDFSLVDRATISINDIAISPDGSRLCVSGFYTGDSLKFAETLITSKYRAELYFFNVDTSGEIKSGDVTSEEYDDMESYRFRFDTKNNIIRTVVFDPTVGYLKTRFIKYNTSGEMVYSKNYTRLNLDNPLRARASDFAIDEEDNIYLAINFNGFLHLKKEPPIVFRSSSYNNNSTLNELSYNDAVLIKFDSSFKLKWYKHIYHNYSEANPDNINHLAIDKNSLVIFGNTGIKENEVLTLDDKKITLKKDGIHYITKIGLCNNLAKETLELKNGLFEAPSSWKNWRWFVDDEEIEDVNWFSHAPKKSGTYVAATRLKDGCVQYTEPYVWYATGTREFTSQNLNIKVYPNPTDKHFTLTTPKEVNSINIYSINGQLVKNISTNYDGSYKITIEKQGIYFINVSTPEAVITKKVVVQ